MTLWAFVDVVGMKPQDAILVTLPVEYRLWCPYERLTDLPDC